MKNALKYGRVAWVVPCTVLLCACQKEKPQWDVDLLGPLVKTTFTIRDLVPDSLLDQGPGGTLTLVYRDELFRLDLDTLLEVPDTSIAYSYVLPFGTLTLPAGATLPPIEEETSFDVDDVQLRHLELREGQLHLTLLNMIASGIIGTFGIPAGTHLGAPVSIQQYVNAGTQFAPATASVSRDLAFHAFDLTGPLHDQVNTLGTELLLQLDPAGSGATITDEDSVIAIATYSGLKPQYARGFLGQRTGHVGPEVSSFGLFDQILAGSIDLDEVTLTLTITNGVGVDARIVIDHFTGENTSTGQVVDLQHAIIPGPINLNRAIDLGGSFQPSVYQTVLTTANSNLDLLLEAMPDLLSYELDLEVNPLGDISNGNDFLYWNSELAAEAALEIPLSVIATGLTLQQTHSLDLPGSAEGHGLQHGELMLFAKNGFPLEATVQLDIVDAAGAVLSPLPVSGSIAPGVLGPDLLVQAPVESMLTTVLDDAQVDLLYTGGRLRITPVFSTSDQTQHLQLLDSYALELQITADVHYIVNGDE